MTEMHEESPAPVLVAHQQPSSESTTPEAAPEVFTPPPSIEDSVRNLIAFVRDGRRAGDGDVDAAIADVEAAFAAQS